MLAHVPLLSVGPSGLNPVKRIWRSCRSQRFALLGVPYLFMFTAESVYIIFVLYLMRRYSWCVPVLQSRLQTQEIQSSSSGVSWLWCACRPREVVGGAISVLAISQAIVQVRGGVISSSLQC